MATPRLVLVHGTRLSSAQWTGYAARLPGIDVVTPDLPGHGARAGQAFSTEAAVAALESAVEAANPATPVVLAGHSLGGYMATVYAARHPDRLDGLVLMGCSAVPTGLGAAAYRGYARLVERVGQERAGRAANRVMARLAGRENLDTVLTGGESYEATADAWAAVMADCRPELLTAVACPVLLLNGGLDHLGVHARRYAACCRDARIRTVRRATHLMPISHPEAVAGALAEFVREVSAAGDSSPGASA
jgi:pimeloyl-ACP methyl ester carboxylesterase